MLRRRIFSSAMASVMALSSVAVVANAEETAVANYKTKADLEAYVASFDGFRENGLYDYGSISGEDFLNAIEYAENVIADVEANNDDYTVAYDMLEATYNALKIYSAEELKILVDSCTAIYEKGNIYNEELNDEIYTPDSFANFEYAYDEALSILGSNDSRVITDTYETLFAAKNGLSTKTVVTKAQFRAALKDYEAALAKQYKYESWRRGSCTASWLGNIPDYWSVQGTTTYGVIYEYAADWQELIYAQYDVMDRIKTLNKTSDDEIVKHYLICLDATTAINAWAADDTARATKNSVSKLLGEYHGLLVHDYAYEEAMELYKAVAKAVGYDNLYVEQKLDAGYTTTMDRTANDVRLAGADEWVVFETKFKPNGAENEVDKDVSATLKVKYNDDHFSIPINDDNGYYDNTKGFDVIKGIADKDTIAAAKKEGITYKKISKKSVVDLTSYIQVTSIEDAALLNCSHANPDFSLVVTATTGGDVIAEVKTIVSEAKEEATEAAEAISALFVADEGATITANGSDFWVGSRKYVETQSISKMSDTGKKIAKKHYDAIYNTLEDILEVLKKYGATVDATGIEEVGAAGGSAVVAASEIDAAVASLAPYTNAKVWANYQNVIGSPDIDVDSTHWNLSLYVDAIIAELEDISEAYNNAANTAFEFVDAEKSIEAAKRTEVHNAALNAVIDTNYGVVGIDGDPTQFYAVDLKTAFDAAMLYLNNPTKAELRDVATNPYIYYFSTNDDIVWSTASGSSAEWALVHRYLKYALEDKYGTSAGTHTKADVKALIEECYVLADLTGDASLFAYNHDVLVDTREAAVQWVKEADKDKRYKDNTVTYEYQFREPAENALEHLVADQVYNKLKAAYDALMADYNAFKYSFQEVHDAIALAEDMIDAGELEATDELIAAIENTSYALSTTDPLSYNDGKAEFNENDAFTSDRFFQGFNRVFTWADTQNGYSIKGLDGDVYTFYINENTSHANLKAAYEALKAEIEKQTTVTVLKGDVNGDGVVNAFDASTLLKNIVNSVAMDAAVADYDGSGVVNALDASAILKAIVNA